MIGKSLEVSEFLEKTLEKLRMQGFDVGEDSNISRILTAMANANFENKEELKDIIKKLTFDGRAGKMLDELYEFFGIPRLVKDVDGATFKIFNNGPRSIIIKPNTLIEYNGRTYRTTIEQFVNPNESNSIFAYPTNYFLSKDFIDVDGYKILLSNISLENKYIPDNTEDTKEEIQSYFFSFVKCAEFEMNIKFESDLEYKSRAKGLIQHFGDGTITKIRNYIMGINNVADVKIEKEFDRTKITIIPDELSHINQIVEQAKEAVDYFSYSPIVFEYPTITVLNLKGLTEQLNEKLSSNSSSKVYEIIDGIKLYLSEYAKNLFLNNQEEISRETIEFILNKYIVDKNIGISINESKLELEYEIYSDEDYTDPIIKGVIEPRQTKKIKTDIVIFGGVS